MTTQSHPIKPHDDLLFAWYQGFYERMTEGPNCGRTHETNEDWNEAYDEGMNEAEALDGPEGRKPFSFPEVPAFMDDATYLRVRDLVVQAARLAGDGGGGDLGENAEFERGMAELILRTGGLPDYCIDGVTQLIHNVAKESVQ